MNLIRISIISLFLSVCSACVIYACKGSSGKPKETTPVSQEKNDYLGSKQCVSCHTKEYQDWTKSDHYLAMQTVSDSSVLGDFSDARFSADGIQSRFLKQGKNYYITTEGPEGTNRDFEIKYVFGYFPLQQYLIELEGGRLQSTRQSWNSRDKKWFHQYPGQRIASNDWLHWTGNSQNWNTMCASCHSTNFKKNYDFESDTYSSTFIEINVACESCHGAGSRHVKHIKSEAYSQGERLVYSGLLYGKENQTSLQLNTCAPCHARKSDLSDAQIASGELLDNLIPELISNENYFADGQIKEEDYEYGSFAQSKMFHNKVKCSDCHNPHSGKILKKGNALCLSCHKPEYDSESHHFHKGKGESTECINCHMPQKTYMGNDHRRDHSFRIPRPDQSLIYNTPNACNSCHSKQSAKWAAEVIKKWCGPKRAYHFSDDLLPGSLMNEKSESHLLKLAADTSQPDIARATAIEYLGNSGSRSSAEALVSALNDPNARIRYQALRALENFPPEVWEQAAAPCLKDKVRAVRIAAADLYHRSGKERVPLKFISAYETANLENQNYLHYNRDFAVGNVMAGDYDLQSGDYLSAVKHYLRGLKKDSMMNYARFNLSAAYNSLGKNPEALKTLLEAASIDPKNPRVHYNLGLLYYEIKTPGLAEAHFLKAEKLGSSDPDLFYNHGLLLQQSGNYVGAEKLFLKGYSLNPGSENLIFAISYLYLHQGNQVGAKQFGNELYRLNPNNSNYRQLFQSLGLI